MPQEPQVGVYSSVPSIVLGVSWENCPNAKNNIVMNHAEVAFKKKKIFLFHKAELTPKPQIHFIGGQRQLFVLLFTFSIRCLFYSFLIRECISPSYKAFANFIAYTSLHIGEINVASSYTPEISQVTCCMFQVWWFNYE